MKIIKSMTQRSLQLNQHGRLVVLLLVALNSIYTFFSTFKKALTDRESEIKILRYLGINNKSIKFKIKKRPFYRSFFNCDDRKEIYLIIRLRIFLEISFVSKSDYSLLHALQTT